MVGFHFFDSMVGFHFFDFLVCGVLLLLVAGGAFLIYFLATANSRQRNHYD
jgi:hypothetical protein